MVSVFKNLVIHFRTWIKFLIILAIGLGIIFFIVFSVYKPVYAVTISGNFLGYTDDKSESHAWNIVELDGVFTLVDVTWDDPVTNGRVSEQTTHRYFNVTGDFMRETSHQWNEAEVPEADGTAYAWK